MHCFFLRAEVSVPEVASLCVNRKLDLDNCMVMSSVSYKGMKILYIYQLIFSFKVIISIMSIQVQTIFFRDRKLCRLCHDVNASVIFFLLWFWMLLMKIVFPLPTCRLTSIVNYAQGYVTYYLSVSSLLYLQEYIE